MRIIGGHLVRLRIQTQTALRAIGLRYAVVSEAEPHKGKVMSVHYFESRAVRAALELGQDLGERFDIVDLGA